VRQDLADSLPVSGYTWGRYRLTQEGIKYAREVIEQIGPEAARKVYEAKRAVTGKSFADLLRDVYARFPEYAQNSVFTG
jgi:hypothetical protein